MNHILHVLLLCIAGSPLATSFATKLYLGEEADPSAIDDDSGTAASLLQVSLELSEESRLESQAQPVNHTQWADRNGTQIASGIHTMPRKSLMLSLMVKAEATVSSLRAGSGSAFVIVVLVVAPLIVLGLAIYMFVVARAPSSKDKDLATPLSNEAAAREVASNSSLSAPQRTDKLAERQQPPHASQDSDRRSSLSGFPTLPTLSLWGSGGSDAGSNASFEVSGNDAVLCPALVSSNNGLQLVIEGQLLGKAQEDALVVRDAGVAKTPIMSIFLSETSKDSGVYIESVLQVPVAFVSTNDALKRREPRWSGPSGKCGQCVVRRILTGSFGPVFAIIEGGLGKAYEEVGSMEAEAVPRDFGLGRFTMFAANEHHKKGPILMRLQADTSGKSIDVFNASEQLVAHCKALDRHSDPPAQRLLRCNAGVDVSMVLSMIVAAHKIGF